MVFDKFSLASLSGCFIKDMLSVKLLSGLVMADPVLKDYFPEKFRSGKLPERDFDSSGYCCTLALNRA